LKRKSVATGPKIFFLRDRHLRVHFGHHGGLEVGAAERVAFAAERNLGAFGGCVLDQAFDLFDRLHVDQRALHDAVGEAVADFEFAHAVASLSAKAS